MDLRATLSATAVACVSRNSPDFPRIGGIPQYSHASRPRHRLLQDLQPFAAHLGRQDAHTYNISAGTRETRDEAGADRIRRDEHDDWNCFRGVLEGQDCRLAKASYEHVWPERHQFAGHRWITLRSIGISSLNSDVLIFDPAIATESLRKSVQEFPCRWIAGRRAEWSQSE
jgi:hypothetical protein